MSISHTFVSSAPEDPDATKVKTSNWNATHTVDMTNIYSSAVHIDLRAACVGDGSTNDTVGVAAAVTAVVAAGGGNIFVAPGKTFLTNRILLSAIGVKLRFYGGGTLKLRDTGAAQTGLIEMSGGTGLVLIDDLILDGNTLALQNNAWGLATVTGTGELHVYRTEVKNVGVVPTNNGVGLASNTGGKLQVFGCNIHDTGGFGVHIGGVGKFDVSHNWIHDTGNTGIFGGPNNNGQGDTISNGGMITGNVINDIRADTGGAGQNGNGINLFHLDNVTIGPNVIKNVAFSFVRINSCSNGNITGIVGMNAGETGMFCELGANNYTISNCIFNGVNNWGIAIANIPAGVKNVVVTGCEVYDFGRTAARAAGIQIEYGTAQNNIIDGNGNAGACWGISSAPGNLSGTSAIWQSSIKNNEIAGCKYDIGLASSVTGGPQRTIISGNNNFRRDANYIASIGAIGGGTSDAGNASAIATAIGLSYRWSDPLWDLPTAQAPPPGEAGSILKINGILYTSDGVAWRPQSTSSTETLTYSASITPGTFSTMNRISTITANNNVAFTINAVPGTPVIGALQTFVIRRNNAAALGALTWPNATYKIATWTQPAINAASRSVTFQYNGTNWIEVSRTTGDVPN